MSAKEKKIVPLKTKLGYTIGSIGDSTAYNIVISFFCFLFDDSCGHQSGYCRYDYLDCDLVGCDNGPDTWDYGGFFEE